jgi:hypothetical protein
VTEPESGFARREPMIRVAVAIQIAGCLVFVWWLHAATVEDAHVFHEVSRFQQSFTTQLQSISDQLAIINYTIRKSATEVKK